MTSGGDFVSSPLAVAAFVKTPGLSPLKTRLAVGIGEDRALTFYRLAVAAVDAVLKAAGDGGVATPYWAVAEEAGLPLWTSHPAVSQGAGGLGERMGRVYAALQQDGGRGVALIGADGPAITVRHIELAGAALTGGADFIIGPATDGGFYLLAGRRPIPDSLWRSVAYSVDGTARDMASRLAAIGPVAWLDRMGDVDTVDDLAPLLAALDALGEPLPAQLQLRRWVAAYLGQG